MPRRSDLRRILLLGSGPIVIGQACEFDYSGTQACKALRDEGFEVVLVNSNPASIMTDPEMADRTYIEPLTPEVVTRVIELERPDALLPTMGGQTALNLAVALAENHTLERFGVELIGADLAAIRKAEDRQLFKQAMERIGVNVCPSGIASSLKEAEEVGEVINSFPRIIRPAFTLGGSGGGIAYNPEEFAAICKSGLDASPVSQILIEKSLLGWKEFELEVMRDLADNVVIVCSIENLDAMGVHTGDSITVAPAQTLTDREYQRLRDQSIAIIREIGVATGGSNIQFAINPDDGEVVVIEMNPRVSRSSALASKATGFPIAKIAARLAVGYTLDEIINDITGKTPACFEPTIDYVVTKIPRFAFEKFKGSPAVLSTAMKSVGEAMAIGRCFEESFQKAMRSLEIGRAGWGCDRQEPEFTPTEIERLLRTPSPERIMAVRTAMLAGRSDHDIYDLSKIDIWFLAKLRHMINIETTHLHGRALDELDQESLLCLKQLGYSDRQIAWATGSDELAVRAHRELLNIKPVFKTVDTCAAEFSSTTPYHYSTYERPLYRLDSDDQLYKLEPETEVVTDSRAKVMILGGGPNRIGQGIEFDYCCCHASFAAQGKGFVTVMVNSNPETVSTDYDTSDRLYFEPLTLEDVLNVIEAERPNGVIVQFGGQTPLKLAIPLLRWLESSIGKSTGTRIWGTSPESIDRAEDREQFEAILRQLQIRQPRNGLARSEEDARAVALRIGYPVVVRPSYVLGGRAMEVVFDEQELNRYMAEAFQVEPDHPVLIDQYLENAVEVDVDALCDSDGVVVIGGLMEHIEPAGIHSGDSACCLPSISLGEQALRTIRLWSEALALALKVQGLINLQFAVQRDEAGDEQVFIIEANPRASRTVPFVAKATGVPLARIATRLMAGETLAAIGLTHEPQPPLQSVKEAVLPFRRFPGADSVLGPEMRSTGEVMGSASSFGMAFAKSEIAAGDSLPIRGTVFLSTHDRDKPALILVAERLIELGFDLTATSGTAQALNRAGLNVQPVLKVHEGRPNIEDLIRSGQIQLVINTPIGRQAAHDDKYLRRAALDYSVPTLTTIAGARAAVEGITALQQQSLSVAALQDIHV
ncbi:MULTISPECIES: carbamoyl-phosphate synthase large subunit [Prochlorococcus]|uniref:carbamoyl-phosphate synthase large subunit n=1 Tax=Prochlorococcus TaxID=1218 RepID=UPI0007B3B223|nr:MULTISPECIES: carbamoyl-phosphate synthase large subunit [Prochlorococcus]KZR60946.1 Carbamoyl-phosphate synthase large chain [Prochlorococcus marinus str. MIT 1312]KZR79802.1 Carbamoyl-phosphate synthase large chain [Prochlorococcus marinus str. MIT 1327]NMO83679.1 carbamoyl-phosphate synthase large subunit [Prochlorococcus sp. P1344]NMP06518.1 carbamoyl-phosphate synthase large subunit [Prochlorococcus sp. P1361]NMP14097.1 carbamoyl-phosphate synthase large subunit [Prochlorococcus sp.P13